MRTMQALFLSRGTSGPQSEQTQTGREGTQLYGERQRGGGGGKVGGGGF